ncbi:MAG: M23 family metallopeptidase [Ilumatobacteraceae bacterium]
MRVLTLILTGLAAAVLPAGPVVATPCWPSPVVGIVTDPFREPECRWCPGNRGIEYEVAANTVVRAAASGTATFVGDVAGVVYVVVESPSGWRLTYGMLVSTTLEVGDRVLAGTTVGRASGRFHFGLRVGDDYRDPAPHLGRLVGRRRLIPVDGAPARAAPAPTLSCSRASRLVTDPTTRTAAAWGSADISSGMQSGWSGVGRR